MANGAHHYTVDRIGASLVYDGRGVNGQLAEPAVKYVFNCPIRSHISRIAIAKLTVSQKHSILARAMRTSTANMGI